MSYLNQILSINTYFPLTQWYNKTNLSRSKKVFEKKKILSKIIFLYLTIIKNTKKIKYNQNGIKSNIIKNMQMFQHYRHKFITTIFSLTYFQLLLDIFINLNRRLFLISKR